MKQGQVRVGGAVSPAGPRGQQGLDQSENSPLVAGGKSDDRNGVRGASLPAPPRSSGIGLVGRQGLCVLV